MSNLMLLALFSCVIGIGANSCNKHVSFQCDGGKSCIHKSWRCDGERDCKDGSDELNCKEKKCTSSEFTCKNKRCIPEEHRCDTIDHCGDNSDEGQCGTTGSFPCTHPRAYICAASHICIDESKLCNKVRDCPMGDDEDPSCGVNECLKNKAGCSQMCVDEKIGYKCACKEGYALNTDGKTCADIDECKIYGICDQKCQNTAGSYKCQCTDGFALQSDGKSCRANGPRPKLVIANLVDISQYSLDGKESNRLVYGNSIGGTVAADVNPHDGFLYWADYVKKTITRSPVNDTKSSVVVANDKHTRADGIAVDWVGANLYWTNAGKKSIEVSKVDGSHRKTLLSQGMETPRGIALFPSKRLMFWTDWGSSPKIERASMDGTDRKVIVGSEHLKWPNTVAIDQVLQRLYWIDSGENYIGSCNLDGTDLRKIFISNTEGSYGLAVFEGHIYWTQSKGSLFSANQFDGRSKKDIRGPFFRPFTVTIAHPLAKPKADNPCGHNNGGCDELCLLSATNDNGFACA